ncbi:hypothetical protein [Devosia sp.]|uniref:hypothetical protein n=1 Tax=Devosia sp. TaxID=1871048 RepID=UPI0037C13B94
MQVGHVAQVDDAKAVAGHRRGAAIKQTGNQADRDAGILVERRSDSGAGMNGGELNVESRAKTQASCSALVLPMQ